MHIHYIYICFFRLCYLHAVCHSTIFFGSSLSSCWLVSINLRFCVCCAEDIGFQPTAMVVETPYINGIAFSPLTQRLTSKTEVKLCSLCNLEKPVGQMVEDGGSRCTECDPLRQRIQRFVRGGSLTSSIKEVPSADMADFYQNHKHTLAKNLKAELTTLCTRTATRSLTIDLVGNGTFMDAVDLQTAYKDCHTIAIYIYMTTGI